MKFLGPPSSGSIAAQTWSRNPYGQYVRARVGRGGTPVYSIAPAIAAWQGLPLVWQQGWSDWSDQLSRSNSLGQTRPLSGVNRFISAWLLLTTAGAAAPTSPPGVRVVCGLTVASLAAITTQLVRLTVESYGEGWWEVQSVQPWCSTGTNAPPGRNATWVSAFPGFVTAGVHTWDRLYPLPPGSRRVFVRTRLIGADGVAGVWLKAGPAVIG